MRPGRVRLRRPARRPQRLASHSMSGTAWPQTKRPNTDSSRTPMARSGSPAMRALRASVPQPAWFDAPSAAPPRITRIDADGRLFLYPEPLPSILAHAHQSSARGCRHSERAAISHLSAALPLPARLQRVAAFTRRLLRVSQLVRWRLLAQISFTGNGPSPVTTYSFRVGAGRSAPRWRWPVGSPARPCCNHPDCSFRPRPRSRQIPHRKSDLPVAAPF